MAVGTRAGPVSHNVAGRYARSLVSMVWFFGVVERTAGSLTVQARSGRDRLTPAPGGGPCPQPESGRERGIPPRLSPTPPRRSGQRTRGPAPYRGMTDR